MKPLELEIWSDIACPWCYVGKRRLEAALERFPERDQVRIVWRAFELDPSAPPVLQDGVSYAERLARKYGTSVQQADGMIARMTEVAAQDGLTFRFDRVRPGNTFDAHRLLAFAATQGLQSALKERLFRAYMSEGEAIGDHEVLLRLAVEAGLESEAAYTVLVTDGFAAEVRADEERARDAGIRGVPFFLFGQRYAVSGAQRADTLLGALTRTWNELRAEAPDAETLDEGAVCGPSGCT